MLHVTSVFLRACAAILPLHDLSECLSTCMTCLVFPRRACNYRYHHPSLALVDELYIELHFENAARQKPLLQGRKGWDGFAGGVSSSWNWNHQDHSMSQQFDVLREMRRCGIAVHAWP